MAQPKEARIVCSECNSFYASESELWKHEQEVHRRSVPEQITFQIRGTQQDSSKNRIESPKKE